MGTTYETETLLYDQVHRRDDTSYRSARYPPYVRQAHEEWTIRISESSEAKVKVVYGQTAQRPITSDTSIQKTPLPL
jgi:hypothetical protein